MKKTLKNGGYLERSSKGLTTVIVSVTDLVFGTLQKLIGVNGMPYFFVLPNLLIFGIFILYPVLMNFVYAFTGGPILFSRTNVLCWHCQF